jgi:hypothetical protein
MTLTLTPAVLKAKNSKAESLKRKLDKLYSASAGLFYVGTEYLPDTDEIHVWVNATATDDTVDSGAFRADTRAWELYRLAQSVVNGILDEMVAEEVAGIEATPVRYTDTDDALAALRATPTPAPLPVRFRSITEDEWNRAPREGYRQAPCTHCDTTGRRQAKGHAEGTTMTCAICCGHGTLWTNNPN